MKTLEKTIFLLLLLAQIGFMHSGNVWADDLIPKDGEWQGSPSVSFVIEKNSSVIDFKISVPLAMGDCDIEISQISITKSGDIAFSHPKNYYSIDGKFKTPTNVEGTATIKICPDPEDKNNVVMLSPWTKKWKADHK
jgi:hypothetical protein